MKIKKYQMGGSFDSTKKYPGTPPKSLKPKVTKTYKNLVDDAKAKEREAGMIKELNKKGAMPASKKNVGKKGITVKKAKGGKEMIKRADGSYSQRGLWDNIRANRGSGKKPTAQMLKQEKKIKAKSKK